MVEGAVHRIAAPPPPEQKKFRILSLDGGGIRGLLTARLLERLEALHPGFLAKTNMFAGTSTGAMLAVGLAAGLPPSRIVSIYRTNGPRIFRKTLMRTLLGLMGLLTAAYGTKNRREALHGALGDVTLGELKKLVLVASFQLDSANALSPSTFAPRRWKPKFFHNCPGLESDGAQKAVDVILRSSAAPTYFPVYQGFVDGGVIANNPAMCALGQAIHPEGAKQDLRNLVVFSVGTGLKPHFLTTLFGNYGLAQWNFRLVDLIQDGSVGLPDYQCRQLLGDDWYKRLDPAFDEYVGIDDAGAIDTLLALAEGVKLDDWSGWIEKRWMQDAR